MPFPRAADRYDDGRSTVSELAQRIMGICAVELTKARLAFHVSLMRRSRASGIMELAGSPFCHVAIVAAGRDLAEWALAKEDGVLSIRPRA